MPTVLEVDGFKFYFFSREGNEPPHIHVEKAENRCKYWLETISLAKNNGFISKDLKKIKGIVIENKQYFIKEYNEHLQR